MGKFEGVFNGCRKKIQKILSDFAKKRDWEKFHNLKNLAISINIESSELLEIFQWESNTEISEKIKKKSLKIKFLMRLQMYSSIY